MKIAIPETCLVLLVGPSGAGKSFFAERHFLPTEVLSSDRCRGWVSDDENSLDATQDAFDVLHFIAEKRLAAARLTVIDATNVQPESRKTLIDLAKRNHCLAVAIILDLPERVCVERNTHRPDRNFGRHVVARQRSQLRRSRRGLKREGLHSIINLRTQEEVDSVTIERTKLWPNRRHEQGPFDIVGDVHGCADELQQLLVDLDYSEDSPLSYSHPDGRRVIFLGDIVDRGPRVLDSYRIVRNMVESGAAMCVPGNHDLKLVKKLRGRKVQVKHGLETTLAELESVDEDERSKLESEMADFFGSLVSHFVLDDGRLVVAHAGMKASYQGRASGRVRQFALYGETTGETDEFGLPIRYDWASEYRGDATVVYGHTPVPEPEWLNRTINIDTGCVFGGRLTALRYPELEFVSVEAAETYAEPIKPLAANARGGLSAQQDHDDLLDMEDVSGKRQVTTRLRPNITIRAENAAAALELMSRFAVDPKWLIYLPPTMSPTETSERPDLLEHPEEALATYERWGIPEIVCEEKHMGSRAVVIVSRDSDQAQQRFGVSSREAESGGICYTRTGRRFFTDRELEGAFLARLRQAAEQAGLFDELETSWLCLDGELMPWSAKAQQLIKTQYAAVGAAADVTTRKSTELLTLAQDRGVEVDGLLAKERERLEMIELYRRSYRNYCWQVRGLEDLKLAPFHLLASEHALHADRDHEWHLSQLAKLARADEDLVLATTHRKVRLDNAADRDGCIAWWEELTTRGGEGAVLKPLDFVGRGKRGLVQPALKCRGREYLRIIYGPEYTRPENLERLKKRGLGRKRSLALREFALGLEALERFVRREPLRRVHECVFGVLALESEPVDPRL